MLKTRSRTVNSMNSLGKKGELAATRMSTRILFRKRLKGISKRKIQPQPLKLESEVEPQLIEIGNEAHKINFLRLLGLNPKSDKTQLVVKLSRSTMSNNFVSNNYAENHSISQGESSDIDDLDLEVMFCPLDIPHIYYEITKRWPPGYEPNDYQFNVDIKSNNDKEECRINKRFSSLTNFDLDSSTCNYRPKFKSEGKLKAVQPHQSYRRPLSQKTQKVNYRNKSLSVFKVSKLLPEPVTVMKRVKTQRRVQENHKTKFSVQFDNELEGVQVVPNVNYDYWNSVGGMNSLSTIKRRLGMLDTELDFV